MISCRLLGLPEQTLHQDQTIQTNSCGPRPKGNCAFYIYDNTGRLIDSGSYTNAFNGPIVEVNPWPVTVGSKPWVAHPGSWSSPLAPDR